VHNVRKSQSSAVRCNNNITDKMKLYLIDCDGITVVICGRSSNPKAVFRFCGPSSGRDNDARRENKKIIITTILQSPSDCYLWHGRAHETCTDATEHAHIRYGWADRAVHDPRGYTNAYRGVCGPVRGQMAVFALRGKQMIGGGDGVHAQTSVTTVRPILLSTVMSFCPRRDVRLSRRDFHDN